MVTGIGSSSSYINAMQNQKTEEAQEQVSIRMNQLLKRAGVQIQGEGAVELSIDENGDLTVGGGFDNVDEVQAALEKDLTLKKLVKTSTERSTTAPATGEADLEDDVIAGVQMEDLADVWAELKAQPNGKAVLEQVVTKLQMMEYVGREYTGELTAEAILEVDIERDYYKQYSKELMLNTPTIIDYFNGESTGQSSLLDYLGGGSSSSSSITDFYNSGYSQAASEDTTSDSTLDSLNTLMTNSIDFQA